MTKRVVSVSTGCFYKLGISKNEVIDLISGLSVDGVEVLFNKPQDIFDFELSELNLRFLKDKSFVTIHAPDGDVVYAGNPKAAEVLDRLENIYRLINAKNIVFHIHKDDELNILSYYAFQASVENDDWRKGENTNTVAGIGHILETNPRLKFALDIGHADSVGPTATREYVENFRDKLSEIHLSYVDKERHEHDFISRGRNIGDRDVFTRTNVPIVIESVLQTPTFDISEFNLLEKEIELVKTL